MLVSATSFRFLTAEISGVFILKIIQGTDNKLLEKNYNPYDSHFPKETMLNDEWIRSDNRKEAKIEEANSRQ